MGPHAHNASEAVVQTVAHADIKAPSGTSELHTGGPNKTEATFAIAFSGNEQSETCIYILQSSLFPNSFFLSFFLAFLCCPRERKQIGSVNKEAELFLFKQTAF